MVNKEKKVFLVKMHLYFLIIFIKYIIQLLDHNKIRRIWIHMYYFIYMT